MKSLKEIEEMADDELRNYVASLVPGLEVKNARPSVENGSEAGGEISISDDGTAGTEAASTGGGVA